MGALVERDRLLFGVRAKAHVVGAVLSMGREHETAGNRHARLSELILEELRGLLRDDIDDPRLEPVRIVALVLSSDLRSARVHYAVFGLEPQRGLEAARALARATPFLRVKLAEGLDLKRVPELRFVFDAQIHSEDDT